MTVLAGFLVIPAVLSAGDRERKINPDALFDNVTASAQARISTGQLSGGHLIVLQDGRQILNACYGYKAMTGEVPMRGNEVYRIASMTKPVCSLALLIEHERGHLNIYDDVAKYLPEFSEMYVAKRDGDGKIVKDAAGRVVRGSKAVNSIKVYQLVSHTSGVGEVSGYDADFSKITIASAAEYLSRTPLDFEPGTAQAYSTGAFDVAARIIELVSGMEFEDYLQKNIFSKLGMTDTTFEPDADQWDRMVSTSARNDGGWAYDVPMNSGCVFANFPATYHAAGAALASTASDYAKFAQMFLDGGKGAHGRVIRKKTLKLYSTPVVDDKIMPGAQKWGLGVRVICGEYVLPETSFGWSGAYGTHFWVDPVNNIVAVYMKNSAYDGGAGSRTGNEFEVDVMKSLEQ
jgi:Beta-lactamase class C and other penicillin binding proteins